MATTATSAPAKIAVSPLIENAAEQAASDSAAHSVAVVTVRPDGASGAAAGGALSGAASGALAAASGAVLRALRSTVAGGVHPRFSRRRIVVRATPNRFANAVTLSEVEIGVGSTVVVSAIVSPLAGKYQRLDAVHAADEAVLRIDPEPAAVMADRDLDPASRAQVDMRDHVAAHQHDAGEDVAEGGAEPDAGQDQEGDRHERPLAYIQLRWA